MRKEIFEALKAKFTGVSDNILGRIADKLAKTVTTAEQVKTAVEGVTIQQVIESYGDSRATEASNTARENAVRTTEPRTQQLNAVIGKLPENLRKPVSDPPPATAKERNHTSREIFFRKAERSSVKDRLLCFYSRDHPSPRNCKRRKKAYICRAKQGRKRSWFNTFVVRLLLYPQ